MNSIVKKTGIYIVVACALVCPRVTVSMSSSSSHMPRRMGISTTLLALAWTWYDTRQREAARPFWCWGSCSPRITPLEEAYNAVSPHTGGRLSQSRNHIDILTEARAPELIAEQQRQDTINTQDAYEARIGALLRHYYRDAWMELPALLRRRLRQAVVVFTAQEEETSDTHYNVYHGTRDVAGMLLRSMLHAQEPPQEHRAWLFRDPSTSDLLRSVTDIREYRRQLRNTIDEEQSRDRELARGNFAMNGRALSALMHQRRLDDDRRFAPYFLCVNPAIMGNSWPIRPKGSNSLCFLTPILPTNSWFNMLEHRMYSVLQFIYASLPSDSMRSSMRRYLYEPSLGSLRSIFNHAGRPDLYEQHRNELMLLSRDLSMVVQIQIPRTSNVRIYNAEPGGEVDRGESGDFLTCLQATNPLVSNAEFVNQNMLVLRSSSNPTGDEAERVDIRQMRIALDPDIWENPANHNIRMNVIIRGDEQQLKQLFAKLHAIAQELKQKS